MKKKFVLLFGLVLLLYTVQAKPIISFFNELQTPALVKLFQDSTLIPSLQKLQAEIRMGIMDLTPERAAIVRKLNQAGIPVIACLMLPMEDGSKAIERYIATKKWAADNQLNFKGIGIGLEFDKNDAKLIKENTGKWIRKIPGRLYGKSVMEDAREQYANLIKMIKADGYFSESYYVPFIKDEITANRSALQLVTRLTAIKTDREIPLLYSSYFGFGDGLIQVYGFDANVKYVVLGTTARGDTTYTKSGILEYEELIRDIDIAAKKMEEIHISNLEGCVENGYLSKLLEHQYDSTLVINQEEVTDIKEIRDNFQTASKILSYPTLILLIMAIILGLFAWLIVFIIRKIIAFIS